MKSIRESIANQTSRHVGRLLSYLESVNTPQPVLDQVRKEIWYLHNDILELAGIPNNYNSGGETNAKNQNN